MEIDKDKLCEFLLSIFKDVESVEKELLAHRAFFQIMKGSGFFSDLDQVLQRARESSQHVLDNKYAEIRAVIPRLLTQADWDQAAAKYLQEWKPTGQAN